jgi:biopolymer transport protein ExbB
MWNNLQHGGLVLWLLLVLSMLAGWIFLAKLYELHRAQIDTRDFLDGLYNVLRRGNTVEAVTICEDTTGPVAQLARAAILRIDDGPDAIAKAIQQAGLTEIPRMERRMNLLATCGKLAPMLGLLGTVLGLMNVMQVLEASAPLAQVPNLTGGMWQALFTTAAGLTVAMPIYAGYNLLVSRMESLVLDMELAGLELCDFLDRNRSLFARD